MIAIEGFWCDFSISVLGGKDFFSQDCVCLSHLTLLEAKTKFNSIEVRWHQTILEWWILIFSHRL